MIDRLVADSVPVWIGRICNDGAKTVGAAILFYEFSLEDPVPQDHFLRSIDRFVDLSSRAHLAEFYSHAGLPSADPELLIRMLLVGHCFGIRSERRLCEEVYLNLVYRWFCRSDRWAVALPAFLIVAPPSGRIAVPLVKPARRG